MHAVKLFCIFLILYLGFVNCDEKPKFQGCIELENLFKEICKEGGPRKEKTMKKANSCYVGMLPPDADKNLKEYFESTCGEGKDFCNEEVRKLCGPVAFEKMSEKQKEGAMSFYEKHEKDFPIYCAQGLKCVQS